MYLKEVVQTNKKSGIRKYLQFVESKRVDGKPRQNILVNLGRVDNKEGKERLEFLTEALLKINQKIALLDVEHDLDAEWSKELGAHLVFKKLWETLELDKVLTKTFEIQKSDFNIADVIFNLVLNRLVEPSSKRHLLYWQSRQFALNHYELQHYYRAMDYLEEERTSIEQQLFSLMRGASKSVNVVLFDTTTIVYYGEGEEDEELLERGFSKDRRSDLKQIVVGVILSKDGIPLAHEVFAGNTNDVTCFKRVIDSLYKKYFVSKVVLVGDRGMVSKTNIEYLEFKSYQYVLGFRMRTLPKKDRREILCKVNLKKITKDLEYKEVFHEGKRLLVCYNAERALLDAKKREEILIRIREKIKNGTILSVIENKDYKRFLKIVGETPTLDNSKIEGDSIYDGVFVLTTNTKMRCGAAVSTYRCLWQCEASFRSLKSELGLGPLFHRKARRIRSHVFLCFISLILKTTLLKKIRNIDPNASYSKTIAELRAFTAIKLKLKNKNVIVRTQLSDHVKLAFKAIKSVPPKKVLQNDLNTETILV